MIMQMFRFLICCCLIFTCLSLPVAHAQQGASSQHIIVCGDDRVLILSIDHVNDGAIDTVWSWRASETIGLPAHYLPKLRTMDECKPIKNGEMLLLTSSSGVALVLDISTKKAIFYAEGPNAHSAELLPNDRVVVANSTASGGNSIELFDWGKPEYVLFRDTLYSGHGVVWVPERERLYALGFDELKVYALHDWDSNEPMLELEHVWKLPDDGGHDLSLMSPHKLLVSTHASVWEFDITEEAFRPFKPLEGVPHVKSVNYDEQTGRLVYTKGEISWWTHHVYVRSPEHVIHIPDIRVYKARVLK